MSRIEYKATQYFINNSKAPLFPPNQFKYVDGRTTMNISNHRDARMIYQMQAKFYSNRFNRRKYVDGAIYTHLFLDQADVICPIPNTVIELDVAIDYSSTNRHTSVVITYDIDTNRTQLASMNELGHSLNLCRDNTNRGNKNDEGKMHIIGKGKMGNGSVGVYNLTDSSEAILEATSKVTGSIKKYYAEMGFTKEMEEMDTNSVYDNMNETNCFVSSIV